MSGTDYTKTTNYGFYKPVPNADNDVWGDHWNTNADSLDALIKTVDNKAGVTTWNTRTGAVTLNQADVTTVLPPGAGVPSMAGTATPGTLVTWSRSDHVHPVDTSRYAASNPAGYVTAAGASTAAPVQSVATRTGAVVLTHTDITDWNATLAPYAPLASPTFTGTPTMPTGTVGVTQTAGDATTKLATTAFVGAALGSVPGGAIVAATPPTASPGALWWDSIGGQLYVRYDDGNTIQWTASSNITGLANAATKTDVGSAQNNAGRNLVHNPVFTVAQRGAGPWTTGAAYTADRWLMGITGGTLSTTINAMNDTNRAQIGDEAAIQSLVGVCVGSAGASDEIYLAQYAEGVRRTAGKTVTLSFWAACGAGTPKLGCMIYQAFGSGGSPSGVVLVPGQAVTLSTTFTRYSLTFSIPSVAGKTLGTNAGTDYLAIRFGLSAGATTSPNYGGIGVQSYTLQLWGVQLEIAQPGQTQPTPLDYGGTPQQQLAACQRFYQSGSCAYYGYVPAGQYFGSSVGLPVSMRAVPTVAFQGTTYVNGAGIFTGQTTLASFLPLAQATTTGAGNFATSYTLSADL